MTRRRGGARTGTTNFVHAYPLCAVSIGVAWRKSIVAGVVYIPALDEMYTAVRGHGAYLNDRRLRVSACASIQEALIVNNIGKPRGAGWVRRTTQRLELLLLEGVQGLRNSGTTRSRANPAVGPDE